LQKGHAIKPVTPETPKHFYRGCQVQVVQQKKAVDDSPFFQETIEKNRQKHFQ
jgi:hypothetical protein